MYTNQAFPIRTYPMSLSSFFVYPYPLMLLEAESTHKTLTLLPGFMLITWDATRFFWQRVTMAMSSVTVSTKSREPWRRTSHHQIAVSWLQTKKIASSSFSIGMLGPALGAWLYIEMLESLQSARIRIRLPYLYLRSQTHFHLVRNAYKVLPSPNPWK